MSQRVSRFLRRGVFNRPHVPPIEDPQDLDPDVFVFTDVTGAVGGNAYVSNVITVTGIDGAAPTSISTSGGVGQYRKNGGAWTTALGTVANGDTVEVQLSASLTGGASVSATLTIGGVSDTFTVTTAVGATLPIPSNARVACLGDSRSTAPLGRSTGGTGTFARFMRSDGHQMNAVAFDPRLQPANDFVIPGYTTGDGTTPAGKANYGNYGVSGQRPDNYLAVPRGASGSIASEGPVGSLTLDALCKDPACIIFYHGFINSPKGGETNPVTPFNHFKTAVAKLTNPANCNGLQKIVVVLDETPAGLQLDGTVGPSVMPTQAAAQCLRGIASLVRGYDYRQPGGHPFVVVASVYEANLDVSTAATWCYNRVGYRVDGLHDSTISSIINGAAVAAELDPILDAMGATNAVAPLLASASNANSINSNARMTGDTGSVTGVGSALAVGSKLPTGWQWTTGGGSIGSQTITTSTFTRDGETVWRFELTWTNAVNYSGFFRQQITAAEMTAKGIVAGDRLMMVAMAKVLAGSSGFVGVGLQARATSTTTANNWTSSSEVAPAKGSIAGYDGYDAGGLQMWLQTPYIETAQIAAGGATFGTSNAGFIFSYLNGDGHAVVEISQGTLLKANP